MVNHKSLNHMTKFYKRFPTLSRIWTPCAICLEQERFGKSYPLELLLKFLNLIVIKKEKNNEFHLSKNAILIKLRQTFTSSVIWNLSWVMFSTSAMSTRGGCTGV